MLAEQIGLVELSETSTFNHQACLFVSIEVSSAVSVIWKSRLNQAVRSI